jgi:hypothetical protein
MPHHRTYGRRPSRESAQLARAQALTAKALRPPPRLAGVDPCWGAVPRRLAGKGGERQQ